MTARTHDRVRLIAVVLNIPIALWNLQYLAAAAQMPLRAWDYKAAFLICFYLAPVFALIAIMVKPEHPSREISN